jgi:recombination protein RecT
MAETQNQTQIARVGNKNSFSSLLGREDFQKSLADVLPKHLTPEKICKMALIAASRQPRIFECTQASVLQSVMKSAELGLDCTGTLGQGFLVPYYNGRIRAMECQFIPGYQGLIDLARRSGNIDAIESRPVYEGDLFELDFGSPQPVKHKPCIESKHRGNLRLVYAQAWLKDTARPVVEWMTKEEIDGIMERSKSRDKNGKIVGPWATDYVEMARKTVIRRLAKYLPLSPEMATALDADNQQYEATKAITVDVAAHAGVQGLKDTLRKQVENTAKEPEPTPEKEPETEAFDEDNLPEALANMNERISE